MSDNPTPKIKQVHCSLHGFMYGYCSECMRTGERGSVYEVPLPPAALAELLEWSKTHVMTDEEKEAQRQSWVRGEAAMNEGLAILRAEEKKA